MSPITFQTGQHRLLNGIVEFDADSNFCTIERIEADANYRRQGKATRMLQLLARQAAEQGVALCACICPDDPDRAVTDGLQRAFTRAGFVPLEEDGECYPLDVYFNEYRDIDPKSLSFA